MEEFGLYQTLSKNLKTTNMTRTQMIDLAKKLPKKDNMAVARLILEHHHKTDKLDVKNPKIPYSGKQDGDSAIFDIAKLPNELRWILWKFTTIS
jgi:hypothetical protein